MKLLYKLLRQDPNSRDGVIATTSALGIIVNLIIAGAKVIIGSLASSIAIISEGINNLADALTSILSLVGAKLAAKHPDEKHPFGYGRIEYLTSLVVSGLIVFSGAETLISSVKLVFEPAELEVSYLALAIVAVSAIIKFFLGTYTYKMGVKIESGSLQAVGAECKGDSYASVITIVSAVVFLVFHLNVDAYAGIITSGLIIKAGIEVLVETISELIGKKGNEELARKLYSEIRGTEGIINAVDMKLHNYGPDAYSGSVNIELDHNKTVGEVYEFIHALQLRIMYEYHVTMVFGMYAVDEDSPQSKQIRKDIAAFCRDYEHVKSYHAIYIDPNSDKLYCDLIVDYYLKDWDALDKKFKEYMAEKYPDRNVILTIETEFV